MVRLDELRHRIESTEDLHAIVRVMKTLSAVSISQYQEAASRLRAYQEVVDLGIAAVLQERTVSIVPHCAAAGPTGLIVFGSDRGLCGRFNEIVVARAKAWLRQVHTTGPVMVVGLRCAARLKAVGLSPDPVFTQPGSLAGLVQTAQSILLTLDRWRAGEGAQRVVCVFNAEAGRGGIAPRVETILPMSQTELARIAGRSWPSRQVPTFDGRPSDVLSAFMRERLSIALMRAGAEALAAEHATRLSAMQAAERNITERQEDLNADYRHKRQETITFELMDLVAAYQCLTPERTL